MPIQFFTNELYKVYDRFNQTFGKLIVFNVTTRQRMVLSIVSLGMLEKKIIAEKNKDLVRNEIQRFVRTRNILNRYFDEVERKMKDAKHTPKSNFRAKSKAARNRKHTIAG